MGRRRGELFNRIAALLADGQWHDREEIIAAAAPVVPFGEALRRREDHKRWQRIRKRYVREQPDPDQLRAYQIGLRYIVGEQLQSMVKAKWVERRGSCFRSLALHADEWGWANPPPTDDHTDVSTEERTAALTDIVQVWSRR